MGCSRNECGLIAIVTRLSHRSEGVLALPSATSMDGPAAISNVPAIIAQAGHGARFAFEEFFHAKIRNAHTRRAYRRAVLCFLEWCELRQRRLQEVSPADVGIYLDELTLSVASKKQVLAGLRHFFDGMVTRHAIALNPALVRARRTLSGAGRQDARDHHQAGSQTVVVDQDRQCCRPPRQSDHVDTDLHGVPSWCGGSAETQGFVRHR